MSRQDQKGVTTRQHLEFVEKSTGRRPKELEGPQLPPLMSPTWYSFLSLRSGIASGFNGPEPIPYTEIKAWCDLTDNELHPLEVEWIKMLDGLYLKSARENV